MKSKHKISQIMFKHTNAMTKVPRQNSVAYINSVIIERNGKRIQCRL